MIIHNGKLISLYNNVTFIIKCFQEVAKQANVFVSSWDWLFLNFSLHMKRQHFTLSSVQAHQSIALSQIPSLAKHF